MNDFFNSLDNEVSNPGNGFEKDITTVGKEPIIAKLVIDPRSRKGAVIFQYFEYSVDGNKYKTPSRESVGLGNDARLAKYKELCKVYKEACDSHGKDSEVAKKAQVFRDKFKPKEGCFLFYIEPNGNKIKCLKASIMIKDQIWGRDGSATFAAVPSLKDALAKKGVSLFLTSKHEDNKKGWVEISRTGEKMGTRYHIKQSTAPTTTIINGEEVEALVPKNYDVSDELYKGFDLEKVPDPAKYESNFVWTEEEVQQYVDSNGTKVPKRVTNDLEKNKKKNEDTDGDGATAAMPPPDASLLDEIPF